MSNELLDYFKEKYSKGYDKNAMRDKMNSQKVLNEISSLCKMYLTDAGQVFRFEVNKKDLPYVIQVIDDESLSSMYNIVQVSETLFDVSLKEITF